jgi:hypothetical protein
LVVPAGGPDYEIFLGADAGWRVSNDRRRCGEINDRIDAGKRLGCKTASIGVFSSGENSDMMPARTRNLCYQRPGFATPEN